MTRQTVEDVQHEAAKAGAAAARAAIMSIELPARVGAVRDAVATVGREIGREANRLASLPDYGHDLAQHGTWPRFGHVRPSLFCSMSWLRQPVKRITDVTVVYGLGRGVRGGRFGSIGVSAALPLLLAAVRIVR
jgi:hypothetical protein